MNNLDQLLDDVQNTRFQNKYHEFIKEYLNKSSQFTEVELGCILMVYHKFVLANSKKAKAIGKQQLYQMFLENFKIFDVDIIESIMMRHGTEHGEVNAAGWVSMFSIIFSNDFELKKRYIFDVYTSYSLEPCVTRAKVTSFVTKMFQLSAIDEDEMNEMIVDLVELIFMKFDFDKDGTISYEEYSDVVSKQPMLSEFLGQVFPNIEGRTVTAYCLNLLAKIPERVSA